MSDKQLYHVFGRYLAVYGNGKESGPIGYSVEQLATSSQEAIDQAARASAREFGYEGVTWLTVQAERVDATQ